MPSSLPTLRPYPWNPPMTCIYTGHPSAWSLSSLPRPWSCWGFSPIFNGSTRRVLGEIFHSNWGGRKNTNGDMKCKAKSSESYCILLRDFCSEIWNIKMNQTRTHLYTPHSWVFLETKSFRGHFSSHPPKICHQPPGKNNSQKPVSLEKLGKLVAIIMASFNGHFDFATASSSKAFMLMTPHGGSLEWVFFGPMDRFCW